LASQITAERLPCRFALFFPLSDLASLILLSVESIPFPHADSPRNPPFSRFFFFFSVDLFLWTLGGQFPVYGRQSSSCERRYLVLRFLSSIRQYIFYRYFGGRSRFPCIFFFGPPPHPLFQILSVLMFPSMFFVSGDCRWVMPFSFMFPPRGGEPFFTFPAVHPFTVFLLP